MKDVKKICDLSDLKVGQKAIVMKLDIDNRPVRRHLLDMGVTRGVEVKVKKIAPMGDPINIELRGYQLTVRKKELQQIKVEVTK